MLLDSNASATLTRGRVAHQFAISGQHGLRAVRLRPLPMTVAQPALEQLTVPETPFGAMVARQLSVWPFAARTARLFLLVDPSLPDQSLRRGLLRAMQQAYFASDGHSQTRAVREAALAAHYVLRHHNRDVLPLDQVISALAVAAVCVSVE